MRKILILAAAAAFLLAGCTSLPERHAAAGGMSMSGMGGRGGMPMDMEKHMQSMQAMHEKMAAAKTPAERQALMQEHTQEHMKMMQERCR